MPVEGAAQADILVDAAKLATALKTVSGRVTITVGDDDLSIKSSERTVRLKTADKAVEFPAWPQFEGQGKAVVNSREMAQALTSVGTDETIPQLMVVAFDNGTMVSHRPVPALGGHLRHVGIHREGVQLGAARLHQGRHRGVHRGGQLHRMVTKAEWVELRSGTRTVTAPMPDTEFPKWKQLIPKEPPLRVVVPRAALLRTAIGEEVTLVIDGETMTVTSEDDGIETEQQISAVPDRPQRPRRAVHGGAAVEVCERVSARDQFRPGDDRSHRACESRWCSPTSARPTCT